MKKIISLMLAFVLMLSLCACLEDIDDSVDDDDKVNEDIESEDTDKEAETDNETDDTDDNSETDGETDDKDGKAENEIVFEEVVVVDNEDCVIKIVEIESDIFFGYTLKAYLENKSADKTYMFSVENAAINGVQCDPFFAAEVAAGKKSNESISFSDAVLEENGITEYTDIELSFRVYDSNDWSAEDVVNTTVHVYPYGEDEATIFEREAAENDNIIIDNEYVTVIVTGYENDDIWGYTANIFLINKTDKTVMFSVDEASVNGYMADPFYAETVSAGKVSFSSISWSDTTLEENDITDVEEIEMTIRAYDSDNWFGDDFANEKIILNP